MAVKIACTGGGTGGHIFPGIAVIDQIRKINPEAEISWIGSGLELEKKILNRFDIPYYSVPAGKLRRYLSFQNLLDLFRVLAGIFASLFLLKRLKADILFSKGGYVAVAPVIAAKILGIPVLTHESDRDPGLATKIIARFADTLLLPYQQSRDEHFQDSEMDIVVSGNPIRGELFTASAEEGRKILGIDAHKPLILVLGGSQGARQINQLIAARIDELLRYAYVVHQMGSLDYKPSDRAGYLTTDMFHAEFPHILAAADLVISRAGAGTVWENGVMGKTAILIPLGTGSSRGDQLRNAELFQQEGAAIVLAGEDASASRLLAETRRLIESPSIRASMASKAKSLCDPSAAEKIASLLLSKITNQEEPVK